MEHATSSVTSLYFSENEMNSSHSLERHLSKGAGAVMSRLQNIKQRKPCWNNLEQPHIKNKTSNSTMITILPWAIETHTWFHWYGASDAPKEITSLTQNLNACWPETHWRWSDLATSSLTCWWKLLTIWNLCWTPFGSWQHRRNPQTWPRLNRFDANVVHHWAPTYVLKWH